MPENYSQLATELNLTPVYENEAPLSALRDWCSDHFLSLPDTSEPQNEYQALQKLAEDYLDLFPLHNRDINIPNRNLAGFTPIQWATLKGYKEFLVQHINNQDPISRRTPLHLAASYGNLEIVQFLLEKKASNTPDRRGIYPLHLSLTLNMIEDTPSAKEKKIQTRTEIYKALKKDKPEVVQKIDSEKKNVAHYMAVYGFNKLLDELIRTRSKLLLERDLTGLTPAHLTILAGQTASLILLLKDERIRKLFNEKGSLLHYAADVGSQNEIMACLKAGCDEHAPDSNNQTPPMLAVARGNYRALSGFNVESLSKARFGENELTLLHLATRANIEASQKWLSENTDLSTVRDKTGRLPEDYNLEQNLLPSRIFP
ncbi:ankyrin repeat domain-containing protein [Legionella lytica]|uniref:Ankyrin repeat domain-containing protein n=1 Tax=Legionella lytica TaxID=96232 RepID=A0ABW8D646_9GAMM